jgi:hypothetical protein
LKIIRVTVSFFTHLRCYCTTLLDKCKGKLGEYMNRG